MTNTMTTNIPLFCLLMPDPYSSYFMLNNKTVRRVLALILALAGVRASASETNLLSVSSSEEDKAKVSVLALKYDLSNSMCSSNLLRRLCSREDAQNAKLHGGLVLAFLLEAQPWQTLEWIADHYSGLSSYGQACVVSGLSQSEHKEAYEVLAMLLTNKDDVVNQRAVALAVGPFYGHLRVCDFAYTSLLGKVKKCAGIPADLPNGLFSHTPIDIRDQAITRLLVWWSKESARILASKASIGTLRPSIKEKMKSLCDTKP